MLFDKYDKSAVSEGRGAFSLLILVGLMFGALVAFIPIGAVVRLTIPFFAILALFFSWAYRDTGESEVVWRLLYFPLLFVVFVSIVWPRYIFFHPAGLPGFNPFTVSSMVVLFFCVCDVLARKSSFFKIKQQAANGGVVFYLLVIWMLWRFVASVFGEYPIASIVDLVKEFVYVGCFIFFGLYLATYESGVEAIAKIILVAGVIVSLIGVYEVFAQKNPFVGFVSDGGDASSPKALLAIVAEKARGGELRAQSTFDHPIVFAQFVASMLPLSIFFVFNGKSIFWRLLAGASIPVAVFAIIKSGSRAGLLSVGVAFVFVFLVWWLRAIFCGKLSRVFAILAVPVFVFLVVISAVFFGDMLAGRNQHESSSTSVRMQMLHDGVSALWDSPIVGFGHGLAVEKAGVLSSLGVVTIDNYFLTIALDYGYVGLALFFALLVVFSYRGLVFSIKAVDREGAFVGACVASVLAMAASFSGLSIYQNMTLFWLLVCATFPFFQKRS